MKGSPPDAIGWIDGCKRSNSQYTNILGGPLTKPTVFCVASQMTRQAQPATAYPAHAMRAFPLEWAATARAIETVMTATVNICAGPEGVRIPQGSETNPDKKHEHHQLSDRKPQPAQCQILQRRNLTEVIERKKRASQRQRRDTSEWTVICSCLITPRQTSPPHDANVPQIQGWPDHETSPTIIATTPVLP